MLLSNLFRGATFDLDRDIPDLAGQVYIVTGASSGLGFAIAAHLLRHGAAKIVTLSSRQDVALASIQRLAAYGDSSRVSWHYCDLRDLQQVDRVAAKLRDSEPRIDGLVLNAGIGVQKFSLSKDNIDNHFQIHVLAQLHIALTLLPVLRKTFEANGIPSRVVFMTSDTHRSAPGSVRFESIEELRTDLGQTALYFRAKLAQILVVRQLSAHLNRIYDGQDGTQNPNGVKQQQVLLVNATNPGRYCRTPLVAQLRVAFGWLGWLLLLAVSPFMADPMTVGCRSALFACTPNLELLERRLDGQYIVPDKKSAAPSRASTDDQMGARLWQLCLGILQSTLGKLSYELPSATGSRPP